ncbi:MAG: ATP-dependent zinc protease [Burkholderiaceae bacterium]
MKKIRTNLRMKGQGLTYWGRLTLLSLLSLWAFALPAQADNHAKGEELVAGYIENAWFKNASIAFQAKLDTGANSSSINAPAYKPFERDGQEWVRIDITNRAGQQFLLETPVDRYVTIRRAGVAKSKRPIVKLEMCVGGKTIVSEFTLADRTGQSYQILVGRKFLKDQLFVDSGKKFLLRGKCQSDQAKS